NAGDAVLEQDGKVVEVLGAAIGGEYAVLGAEAGDNGRVDAMFFEDRVDLGLVEAVAVVFMNADRAVFRLERVDKLKPGSAGDDAIIFIHILNVDHGKSLFLEPRQ